MKGKFGKVFLGIGFIFAVIIWAVTHSTEAAIAEFSIFLILYLALKGSIRHLRGSLGIGGRTSYVKAGTSYAGNSSRSAASREDAARRQREADQAVWERTKARNEQIYQEYQARKNAGTYAGYQAQNRALAAKARAGR